MFTIMNVVSECEDMIKKINKEMNIYSDMSDNEIKAYELATENTLSILESLLNNTDYNVIHNIDVEVARETDIFELIDIVKDKYVFED